MDPDNCICTDSQMPAPTNGVVEQPSVHDVEHVASGDENGSVSKGLETSGSNENPNNISEVGEGKNNNLSTMSAGVDLNSHVGDNKSTTSQVGDLLLYCLYDE